MSVAGITSSLLNYETQSTQNSKQQMKQEFQQLGQDLESGNLSAAQSDFTTLEQLIPQNSSTSSTQSNNPIAQAFQQLAQDLQSGNLSGAQQDYTTLQQDFQSQASQSGTSPNAVHGHHHHHGGGNSDQSEISQLFAQLGQALQSGNLSTAQQVFSTMQQDFPQLGQTSAASATTSSGTVSVTA
jgi:outer membrane protein assembly factor BamD (BamD/ComL family)